MVWIKRILKSKTYDLNAGYFLLVALIGAIGYQLSPEIVAAGAALLNWAIRPFTTKALKDK